LGSIALIFTTSGTTGTPKLIPVTHQNLFVTADKMRQWFNLSSADRTALVLSWRYGAAMKISLVAPLLLGGSVALPADRHIVDDLAEWLPKFDISWLWGNPTFFQAVLDRLSAQSGKLAHALRFVVSGTAYLSPTLRTKLQEALRVPVLQSYGMSEAGVLAADPAPPGRRKPAQRASSHVTSSSSSTRMATRCGTAKWGKSPCTDRRCRHSLTPIPRDSAQEIGCYSPATSAPSTATLI
jgi:acyl-CoA synthetase (AMP-forming)/AMP-acid ligase II